MLKIIFTIILFLTKESIESRLIPNQRIENCRLILVNWWLIRMSVKISVIFGMPSFCTLLVSVLPLGSNDSTFLEIFFFQYYFLLQNKDFRSFQVVGVYFLPFCKKRVIVL